ncbi:MAG: hypothetical protein ACON5B_05910 [Myxococcota bacterium]
MRAVVALAALMMSNTALAGGVGPLVTGGFHTEQVYYYSTVTADGFEINDIFDYEQFRTTQVIGNAGAGLELVLGDRDDDVRGVFRFYWQMDLPQVDPATTTSLVDPSNVVAAYRDDIAHTGVGTVGLQWTFFRAASDNFRLGASAHIGSGFITVDKTEYLLVQPGINASYQLSRTLELWTDITYGLRLRKTVSHGMVGAAGLRVLFD